jgi:hypothetical protein
MVFVPVGRVASRAWLGPIGEAGATMHRNLCNLRNLRIFSFFVRRDGPGAVMKRSLYMTALPIMVSESIDSAVLPCI